MNSKSYDAVVFVYLVDKVLVARVVRGDNGEDVPVILLHDVQHDGGLLLDGRAKLEKHGVVVLETRDTQPISKQGHESFSVRGELEGRAQMIMERVQLLHASGTNILLFIARTCAPLMP